MSYCYKIFKGPQKIAVRRAAVELLRVVADRRARPWIPEFLDDSDPDIQSWGIGVLDQLLFSELIWPEEAEETYQDGRTTPEKLVRDGADRIRPTHALEQRCANRPIPPTVRLLRRSLGAPQHVDWLNMIVGSARESERP